MDLFFLGCTLCLGVHLQLSPVNLAQKNSPASGVHMHPVHPPATPMNPSEILSHYSGAGVKLTNAFNVCKLLAFAYKVLAPCGAGAPLFPLSIYFLIFSPFFTFLFLSLQKNRTRYDLRKFFFANRVINLWNSLPNSVVHAVSTNMFKTRLDKFWMNQEIIYDYHAEIQGTGSRSEIY